MAQVVDCYHGTDLLPGFASALVTDGLLGFIHKASEGAGMKDALCRSRIAAVQATTVMPGVYHGVNGDSPSGQIANLSGAISGLGQILLCLDVEKLGSDTPPTPGILEDCVELCIDHWGRHPVIYGSNMLQGFPPSCYAGCEVWAARYASDPPSWINPAMWQDEEFGNLAGVNAEPGTLDLSRFVNLGGLTPEAWWAKWSIAA